MFYFYAQYGIGDVMSRAGLWLAGAKLRIALTPHAHLVVEFEKYYYSLV